jgi:hypothetical protein
MSGVKHDALSDIVGFERIIAVPVLPVIGARSTTEIVEFVDGVSPSGARPHQPAMSQVSVQAPGCEIGYTRACPLVSVRDRWCPLVSTGTELSAIAVALGLVDRIASV